MKLDKNSMKLYIVTDRTWLGDNSLVDQVECTIKNGATFVQLREKDLSFDEFVKLALQIKAVTDTYNVPFVINDNIDVAKTVDADGVHIGQGDQELLYAREILGPNKIIGVSCHNVEEALIAEKNGADYIGVGAVFSTSTKLDASSVSFDCLQNICNTINIPVVAIGGISKNNILKLQGSGVNGVAVISAIFAQSDIAIATKELLHLSNQMTGSSTMQKVLTIAGSDCSGGAGIQADIKTITAHKMYAMSAITALTAQNTTGVYGVLDSTPEFVASELDAIFTDIVPDAVKIGMVSNKDIIKTIAHKLKEYDAKNIVLDPVMISTSGSKLLKDDAMDMLINELMPIATLITPNIPEAECLCGFEIHCKDDMIKAAKKIATFYKSNILIKGGHLSDCSDDLLYADNEFTWYECAKINNPNTHGTGCTLSSAIACNLAKNLPLNICLFNAKAYITGALEANLDLGQGSGPLNHCWNL